MTRASRAPRWVVLLLLFAAAALLSGITMLKGVQPNDEGLMLQAARRIAAGQVPYRDFWWYYPPGQPYLLAGLWKLFGPSLLEWRIVRVAADASVATLAFALAARRAPAALALLTWLAAACAMAFPGGPHPFPIALALALGALLTFERRPVVAGVLAGLCALWRIEFAGYLAVAVAIGYLAGREPPRQRMRRLARFVLPAAGVGAALYAPVVAAAGLGRAWDLLVRYPLVDFQRYQSLPFPFRHAGGLDVEGLLNFYLPLALMIGLGGALVALVTRFRRDEAVALAVAVFALGMAHYMLVRTDLFHTAPLAVLVAVLAVWVLALLGPGVAWPVAWLRWPARAGALAAAVGLGWALAYGGDHRVRGVQEHMVAVRLPIADGVQARPGPVRPLELAARYVRARVHPGQPIYVTGARADVVTSGNPLFYVVVGRPNPTRYDIAAPGVVTSAPVQREIVRDLVRTRPLVVRWTAPATAVHEPNRAGRSSGVRILDDYLARAYALERRFGDYLLLTPRPRTAR